MSKDSRSAMGNVRRLPSGRWRARVTVGTDADGKRAVASRTFDHKRDAERWALADPATAKHRPRRDDARGDRGCLAAAGLPYIPLSKMRRSHESMMQQAHVLDSINAAMRGRSQQVAYRHYQRADETQAVIEAQRRLRLVR